MVKILLLSATSIEHNEKAIFSYPIHIIGLGKISAAQRTTELILKHDPDLVINFGSCGNLKSNKIGEILEVGTVYNNIDARPLAPYGTTPFENIGNIKINPESHIKCFSTDQFYHKNDKSYRNEYLNMIEKCDIVDMELYSIAWVCMKLNKKLASFKWISDDGESSDWKENAALGFEAFKIRFKEKYVD